MNNSPLQTQTKVISIVSLTLTAIGSLVVIEQAIHIYIGDLNRSALIVIGIECMVFGTMVFVEILCLVGAIKSIFKYLTDTV